MSDQEEESTKLFAPRRGSSLDESQLEYTLILVVAKQSEEETTTTTTDAKVEREYEEMLNYVEQIAEGYIWNNERFYLNKPVMFKPKSSSSSQSGSQSGDNLTYYTTSGIIDYGDNIEDEWYVVYLLYKLSEKYPNLMCQCVDSDGEFMLIQAANHLPHWASHATHMTNRVFIHRGKLHLIPPAHSPAHVTYAPQTGSLTNYIQSASHTILDFPSVTEASASIQQSIKKKTCVFDIDNYSFHRATCLMPTKLAILLKNNPHLISKAINRFCDKDPSDMRLCRTLTSFKPADMINYRVLFTKHLYSKLKYSELRPDKRHHWPQVESSAPSETREKSTLGFKLTCAFEILSKVVLQNEQQQQQRGTGVSGGTTQSKSFDSYVKRLQNLGYFRNYLENSKKYNELYEIARESFDANNGQATSSAGVTIMPTVPAASSASVNPVSTSTTTATTATTPTATSAPHLDSVEQKETTVSTPTSLPTPPPPSATLPSANLDQYARLMDSIYLDKLLDRDYIVKIKEEISTSQDAEKDDSEEWLCVDAPQLDDYLEMYSRGDVGSTYDFRLITTALRNFINKDRSKGSSSASAAAAAAASLSKRKAEVSKDDGDDDDDDEDGVEFNPIDRRLSEDNVLVDFNVDSIEENIREFLKKAENKNRKDEEKKGNSNNNNDDDEDDDDEEDDTFYAVGGDEVDDTEDYETNKLSDSLKTYMSSMDEELREFKSLSRLETASGGATTSSSDNKDEASTTNEDKKKKKKTEGATEEEELEIDMNLVTNALESYSSQLGLTGPVSNILKSLGI